MKSNFVLIALVAIMFVFAAGCEKKKSEQNETASTIPDSDVKPQDPPPEATEEDEDPEPAPNIEKPKLPPIDSFTPALPVETPESETPKELRITSNLVLNKNLDALELHKQAPVCGNVYRLYLAKLYDGKASELYALLDAASQKRIAEELETDRETFESEEAYAEMLKYFKDERKTIEARKEDDMYEMLAKLNNYAKLYKKIKETYTKEMTATEYYEVVATFHGDNDERVLKDFLKPARAPVVTETVDANGKKCTLVMDGYSKARPTKRIIKFVFEDGEWKIVDPFENY